VKPALLRSVTVNFERFVSRAVTSRTKNRRDSLRTLTVLESAVSGSGEADAARGTRRAAAKRYSL
jgi:hypothetical protein